MSPFAAELIGTMFLILLGAGVVANVILKGTKGNSGGWMVITTGWALAVFVGVVIAGPYSGAHLNPAVSIALAMAHKFNWSEVPMYVLAQLLGAMLGSFLAWVIYRDHFNSTSDPDTQLAVFSTGPAIRNNTFNLLSEIIGTFVLIFVIFYFTDAEIREPQTPIGMGSLGALPVTFLVWAIGLSLGGTTGYAINPARDLGPRIVHALLPIKQKGSSNWKYAWIPVIGPIIGAIIAATLYLGLKGDI
ncbi:aquaporin family protein [Niastella caeni]|uniref:Aquaporin family protein n=1 Tax=Niastella caeni TaxID=2569763 RepID=A0A4S8HNM5_9BACT|nr:MIP/aquaporin family protein [Niastella caeni]THU36069.1 aquaporin family protein [Niastella caeni]